MEYLDYGWLILTGGIAGYAASLITNADNGIITSVILGIVGGLFGSWLFGLTNISIGTGMVGEIITAAVGAVILIAGARIFTK